MKAAVPNNPNAPSRYRDEVTEALDEAIRRIQQFEATGFTLGPQEAREIVFEVKRERQVAKS